jgi:hypothetical protein
MKALWKSDSLPCVIFMMVVMFSPKVLSDHTSNAVGSIGSHVEHYFNKVSSTIMC